MRGVSEDVRKLLIDLIRRKIALRAYELYEARGMEHGRDIDDWLRAEDEVLAQSISVPLYADANRRNQGSVTFFS